MSLFSPERMVKRSASVIGIGIFVALAALSCDTTSFSGSTYKTRLPGRVVPRTLSDQFPRDALLAFYDMDGSAVDATGNGHHGAVFGARPVRDRFGQPRSAYHFDGQDDYITLGRSNSLKIQLPISISMWVKLDQVDETMAAMTTDFHTVNNTGVFATFDSHGANPSFSFGDGGRLGHASRRTKHGFSELQRRVWYHIAGVIEGPDDITVYLNGADDGGSYDGSATTLAYSDGPSSIGIRTATANAPPIFFAGAIDELAIFGVALTPNEIWQLYSARH